MYSTHITALALLSVASMAVAETHTIVVGGQTDTFEVAPGDTVIFEIPCVSFVWSGYPCSPDGVFSAGAFPPSCDPVEWIVPQFASAELPFSQTGPNSACDILWSGHISVIGDGTVLDVPGDHATIQGAIDSASDGDTIAIAAGTYYEHDLNVQGKGITIRGEADAQGRSLVTIDAQRQGRVLKIDPGDADHLTLLSNLTLTGGLSDTDGGGLHTLGSGFVRNCTLVDNEAAGFGGGVYMAGFTPEFGACQFTGNSAANGGGVYSNLSYPSFVNCVIDQNTATDGLTGGLCQITSGGGKGGPPSGRTSIADSNVCGNVPEQQSGWISATNTCFTSACQGDDDGDGLPDDCFGDADGILNVPDEYPTIQDAVDFATDGQVVMIAAGTYEFSGDVAGPEPGPAFYVHGKSITIRGEQNGDGSPAVTILGDESDPPYGVEIRAFPGEEQPVILEHLKISGCIFGLLLDEGTHTVLNCVFENNLIAGMYITSAQVEVTYSFIHDGGTGIWLEGSGADASLLHCFIEDNSATNRAAGIHAPGGDLSLDRCIVRNNAAYTNQLGEVTTGGLHIASSSSAILTDTIVCGNLVDDVVAPQIEGPWTDGGGSIASEACGSTIHVPTDYATIQEAVDAAGIFDTIAIAAGTYGIGDSESPGLGILNKAITLSGETNSDGSPAVVLQGEGDAPMVYVSNGAPGGEVPPVGFMETVSLEGLKMIGCDLILEDGVHAVTNCTVEGGMGGVNARDVWQLTMTNCIVRENHGAPWSGVIAVGAMTNLTLVNCVVEDNSSQPAGWWPAYSGIGLLDGGYGGVISLQDCTIRNNHAISPPDDPVGFAGIIRWESISDPSLGSATFEDTTVCGNLLDGKPGLQVHGEWSDDGGNTIEDQCASDCPGDINDDGVVDGTDLALLLAVWNSDDPPADIDGNGIVDAADLAQVLGYWGACADSP